MNKQDDTKKIQHRFLIGAAIYVSFLLAVFLIANTDAINAWIIDVLMLFRPVIIGLVLAYLCNPFFRFFERKAFCKLRPAGLRRGISLLCAFLALILIIALVLLLILPSLIESLSLLVKNYNDYVAGFIGGINSFLKTLNSILEPITRNPATLEYFDGEGIRTAISSLFGEHGSNLFEYLKNINIESVIGAVSGAFSWLADIIFGIFAAIYLLLSKELRYAQIMKLRRALFNDKTNAVITRICTTADRSFGNYLEGKIVDSVIVSILMYIVASIFRIPYAMLVAAIIGLANIIPVIGPLIGAVPSVFIILLAEPSKILPFIIILFIIQQIDGNFIGPKLLGENNGVSSLCVMIAITTVGTLWGFTGLILGVPLFATVLEIIDYYTVERLQKKGYPSGVQNYYAPDSIVDPMKDALGSTHTDKWIKSLEKKVLYAEMKKANGIDLTRGDRMAISVYTFLCKYHIIPELSDETATQFITEDTCSVIAGEFARKNAMQDPSIDGQNEEEKEAKQ